MAALKDLTGQRFGKLMVLNQAENRDSRTFWNCVCECKNEVCVQTGRLLDNSKENCGCESKKPGFPPSIKVGDLFKTTEGYFAKIISYNKHDDIMACFEKPVYYEFRTYQCNLKSGNIKNRYHNSVYDVGCLGECVDDWSVLKPYYNIWAGVVERLHCPVSLKKRPSYRSCTLEPSWYNFSNFYNWMVLQKGSVNKGWHLDKDILIKGNKHYGPDTCCFVPQIINGIFTKREACRGELPIGVQRKTNGTLVAVCSDPEAQGGRVSGAFGKSKEECFIFYKQHKESVIKRYADKFKHEIDERVYKALYSYQVEITD